MKRDILEKPFESAQIKQRVGAYGNVLDYIEGHTVIKRLNDAFDGAWRFEILRHKVLEETDHHCLTKTLSRSTIPSKFITGYGQLPAEKESLELNPPGWPAPSVISWHRRKGDFSMALPPSKEPS